MHGLFKVSKAEQLRAKYREGSEVFGRVEFGPDNRLNRVSIELHGPIGRIPSLKNSKIPGKNFMANDVRQRLRVMDELFDEVNLGRVSFGDSPVAMFLVCGKRPNAFDKDNCVATVQDWLEPRSKPIGKRNKKPRGWGIGLVNNDRQITSFAFYDHQLGRSLSYSMIVVVRWEAIGPELLSFAEKSFLL